MHCVKVRTRSLLQPSQATALHASHNSFPASTNVWNDLAKAMKASDGKKKHLCFYMCKCVDGPSLYGVSLSCFWFGFNSVS